MFAFVNLKYPVMSVLTLVSWLTSAGHLTSKMSEECYGQPEKGFHSYVINSLLRILTGKVSLSTGGNTGLGYGTAKQLLLEGYGSCGPEQRLRIGYNFLVREKRLDVLFKNCEVENIEPIISWTSPKDGETDKVL
ncbi:hypothetical protein C8R44DRAFT_736727 [Mycena epipterygia]|nr:hypothetical protein C8R44DRAFT_736727 [Mycena epipterygia]